MFTARLRVIHVPSGGVSFGNDAKNGACSLSVSFNTCSVYSSFSKSASLTLVLLPSTSSTSCWTLNGSQNHHAESIKLLITYHCQGDISRCKHMHVQAEIFTSIHGPECYWCSMADWIIVLLILHVWKITYLSNTFGCRSVCTNAKISKLIVESCPAI